VTASSAPCACSPHTADDEPLWFGTAGLPRSALRDRRRLVMVEQRSRLGDVAITPDRPGPRSSSTPHSPSETARRQGRGGGLRRGRHAHRHHALRTLRPVGGLAGRTERDRPHHGGRSSPRNDPPTRAERRRYRPAGGSRQNSAPTLGPGRVVRARGPHSPESTHEHRADPLPGHTGATRRRCRIRRSRWLVHAGDRSVRPRLHRRASSPPDDRRMRRHDSHLRAGDGQDRSAIAGNHRRLAELRCRDVGYFRADRSLRRAGRGRRTS